MKFPYKILKIFSALIITLSAFILPAFADDPQNIGDGDEGAIIGEMDMIDVEDILGENGQPQTSYTDLQTYVPTVVKLDIGPNGSVKHNKKTYSKNTSFETMTLVFYIIPKSGYEIDHVYWNGKDVTNMVSNGILKIKDLEDGTLTVRFRLTSPDKPKKPDKENKKEQNPKSSRQKTHHIKTSDKTKYQSRVYILITAICLICFAITFIKKKKMRYLRKK